MELFRGDILQSNKNITGVFAALLFFAAIYRFPARAGEVRASFMILMDFAVALALVTVLWQYTNKYVALFLIAATLSSFYPAYGPYSFQSWHMVFVGLTWYLIIVHFSDRDSIGLYLDVMCAIAIYNLLAQVIQYEKILWLLKNQENVIVGFMANPNEASALYVFCLPAFLRKGWVKYIPLVFLGIYLSSSAMGYMCVVVGSLAIVYWARLEFLKTGEFQKSALMFGLTGSGIAVILYYLMFAPVESLTLRVQVWIATFKVLKQHWITGCGIGHWKTLFTAPMPFDGKRWMTAHNEFYQLWAEMGIVPLIILAGYFINIFKRYIDAARLSVLALILISVNSFGNFPFHIAPLALIAVTWFGIMEIQLKGVTT